MRKYEFDQLVRTIERKRKRDGGTASVGSRHSERRWRARQQRDKFDHHQHLHGHLESFPPPENPSFTSTASFTPDADGISPIVNVRDFFREFFKEAKKLWFLTGPAIFTFICQYSLSTIT
ncbi:hypothetical protein FF1_021621 [Malus domestica]